MSGTTVWRAEQEKIEEALRPVRKVVNLEVDLELCETLGEAPGYPVVNWDASEEERGIPQVPTITVTVDLDWYKQTFTGAASEEELAEVVRSTFLPKFMAVAVREVERYKLGG